jgi:KDO2-lipid IV(A) lauroyltransferase
MTTSSEAQAGLASRIGDSLKFWGFRGLSWLAGHLPLPFCYWVADRIGAVIYLFWHEHSGNAVSNMARVLGPGASSAQIRRAARRSFRNYIRVLIDFIRVPYADPVRVERETDGTGWENLRAGLARGKGVILVGCHMGNWDYAGVMLQRHQLPITAVADSFRPQRLDDYVIAQRARIGIRTISVDPGAVRRLFEALRRNEIIMLFVDRPVPGEGVEVEFFGEGATVPAGPAAIALKTGAAVVPGYFMRDPNGRGFIGAFDPPLDYALTGDKERDVATISQAIMAYMEALIRRNPSQWYMFRPMWPKIVVPRRPAPAGRGAPERALAGTSLGISVDPPVIEEWASGRPAAPPAAPGPPPPPAPTSRPRPADDTGG